jgi:WD40 repeat protein
VLLGDERGDVGATTTLWGLGGYGKTTLVEIIRGLPEMHKKYTGGILWATVGKDTAGPGLARILRDLYFQLSGVNISYSDPGLIATRLAEGMAGKGPLLLVADDIWTQEQFELFRTASHRCRLLITTRNQHLVSSGGDMIEVDQMTSDEARAVIGRSLEGVPDDLLSRLTTQAGRWPVLLNLIRENLSVYVREGADIVSAGSELMARLEAAGPAALDVSSPQSRDEAVARTMRASIDRLSPADWRRYHLLSIFPAGTDLPTDVLAALWGAVDGLKRHAAESLRIELTRLGLAEGKWTRQGPAVRLPDVFRAYLRHESGEETIMSGNRALLGAARQLVQSRGTEDDQRTPWWDLPSGAHYLSTHLIYHLLEARLPAEAAALATDLRWAESTVRRTGSSLSIEADLMTIARPGTRELARALRPIGHLLPPGDDPGFPGALAARLTGIPGIEPMVRRYRDGLTRPRLDTVWPLPDQPRPEQVDVLKGHTSWVITLARSSDGSLLASAGDDATIRIWDPSAGTERLLIRGHRRIFAIDFSPDGSRLVSAGDDATVRLWDVRTGAEVSVLTGHRGWVRAVSFSPNGRLIATAGNDGTVRIWNPDTGVLLATLDRHRDEVLACRFSPDGRSLVSAGSDGRVYLWNMDKPGEGTMLSSDAGEVHDCAFSPDGSLIASAGDREIRVRRRSTGACVAVLHGHEGPVRGIAFSPAGELLVSCGDDMTIRLWTMSSGTQIGSFRGHTRPINDVVILADGKHIASASDDTTVRIWETVSDVTADAGNELLTPCAANALSCAFSPDGVLIASGGNKVIWLRRAMDGHVIASLSAGCRGDVSHLAFSPGGRLLASVDDSMVQIWDVGTRTMISTLPGDTVRSCCFNHDGSEIISFSYDGCVRARRLESNEERVVLAPDPSRPKEWIRGMAISPRGDLVAIGGKGGVDIISAIGPREFRFVAYHVAPVLTFSPDGRMMAAASSDPRGVNVWTIDNCHMVRRRGNVGLIRDLAFSSDGRLLAIAGRTVAWVWDLTTDRIVHAYAGPDDFMGCAWHGRRVAFAGSLGTYVYEYVD